MFKFDFQLEVENDGDFNAIQKFEVEPIIGNNAQLSEAKSKKKEIVWHNATAISISADGRENLDIYKLNSTQIAFGDITIDHIVSGYILEDIHAKEDDVQYIAKAEEIHSDLIPGVYEGGAKIWECTMYLLKYMSTHIKKADWQNKRVLDLGCGAGLLGIYAYKNGATVHFQDYNKDVITQITIPNVLLNEASSETVADDTTDPNFNIDPEVLKARVKFFAGDWHKYLELTNRDDEKFDFILTSETIYNPENQQKLLDTLHAKLHPKGIALLAAKTYYFGVGGGLREFEKLVIKDKRFKSKVLCAATEGIGREILEIQLL